MQKIAEVTLNHLVNSVAISRDGGVAAGGTYFYPYPGTIPPNRKTDGTFGTYAFDREGKELWRNEYVGNEGIYSVAVSGDGSLIASGGLLRGGRHASDPTIPGAGLIRAFDVKTGATLLDYSDLKERVNSVSASYDGSVVAAGTIDGRLLVFSRAGGFEPQIVVDGGPRIDMVAVHTSGDYLIACGWQGSVHLVTLDQGTVDTHFSWEAGTDGLSGNIKFLACALADSHDFVVGGRRKLILFTKESMTGARPTYVDHVDLPDGGTAEDLRWVAISQDGKLVSAVQNLGNDLAGMWLMFRNEGGRLKSMRRPVIVGHNPNSTSLDAVGRIASVADGHPVNTPGTFYVFNVSDGKKIMEFETSDMNWPMVLSADGATAVGGSDNGKMYFFSVVPALTPVTTGV